MPDHTHPETMLAARLHGPADMRVERVPHPGPPPPGHVLLRVTAAGICGSDLHAFRHAQIGESKIEKPLILGHEFAGVVEQVGENCLDGQFQPIAPGAHVAVDPAQPCGRCEFCERGDPNLCTNLHFCGLAPDDGAFCQWMHMPASSCFVAPDVMDEAELVLIEPLGVAMHAVDLAKLRIGQRVAVLGAGPVGLCIVQLVKSSGADMIYSADKFPWRVELARQFGANEAWCCDRQDTIETIRKATGGRGVDVVIEAAWSGEAVAQAAEIVAPGGRLVIVGISEDEQLTIPHAVARRKGLTIVMVRRMKHIYPRAIRLVGMTGANEDNFFRVLPLVSHRVTLADLPKAFKANAAYRDKVVKVIVDIGSAD